MVERFKATGNLFFTELWLGDTVIASTSNLISGGAGFAFKIGWHPAYARMAPALLNEYEFIRRAPAVCGDLSYVDSGATEESFINKLWVGRRRLASGIFAITPLGRRLGRGVWLLRKLKRTLVRRPGRANLDGRRTATPGRESRTLPTRSRKW
jgi:hypothetical protein